MSKISKYRFSDLYDMTSGISSTKEQAGHGSPFLSFSTVFNNYFLPDLLSDRMNTSITEQETFSIKSGDIFVTRTSETIDELAMSCVALKDYPQATYSGFVKRLRPRTTGIIYDKYISFYLRSKLFRKTMTNNATMTLRASFNEDIFSFLYLYMPPYDSQVKIGDMLYNIEKNIQINRKINDNLEQQLKLIYDYWFTQFDFPDENGKPYRSSGGKMVWNEQLKREIPQDWCVKNIKEIASLTWGQCPDGSNILPIDATDATAIDYCSGAGDMHGDFVVECKAKTNDSKRYAKDNDILISIAGKIGSICIVDHYISLGRAAMAFSANDINYQVFIYEVLKQLNKKITTISSGSIQKVINSDHIDEFIFPFSEEAVQAYGVITNPIYLQLKQLAIENKKLVKLRDWLLPMLMNGQATIED